MSDPRSMTAIVMVNRTDLFHDKLVVDTFWMLKVENIVFFKNERNSKENVKKI